MAVESEQWLFVADSKMLDGSYGGIEEGFQNDITCILISVLTRSKLIKIEMY